MAVSSVLVSLGTFVAIYAVLALGLNLKFGYSGLLDIGHVAFYLIGAYTAALLVLPPARTQQFADYVLGLSLPWWVAIPVAVVAAGVFGMLVALPAIRLREDYLAITVLGVSVIAQRIVQNEGWLANGPGSLRGYSLPLQSFFALPGEGAFAALLFGGIVFVLWTVGTHLLATVGDVGDAPDLPAKAVHGLLAVTTLGAGYAGARYALRGGNPLSVVPVVAVGVVVGAVGAASALVLPGPLVALVFLGAFSLFTWVVGGVALADHYAAADRRDGVVGLGLALGFVVAFLPLIVLGAGTGDLLSTVGLLVSGVLLIVYLYGLYYLGDNWGTYGSGAPFVRVLGIAAVWLFLLRYFALSLVTPLLQGGVAFAVGNVVQNVLWLLKFTAAGVQFDYSRFLLVFTLAVLAVSYYVVELTVDAPFGRVLKAIRDDEDVARALGKNTFAFKVQSMILGSALAGLAGALWAVFAGSLVHTMFAPRVTFIVFLMVIIGGTANNRGVILGSIIYWAFQKGTADIAGFFPTDARSSVQALRLAFIGALLIVILYYRPEGIWGEETATGGENA